MEKEFEILSTIKKVQPDQGLFDRIIAQVEKPIVQLVSPLWLKVAATIIIGLIAVESYILTQSSKVDIMQDTFITVPSNDLYNE